MYIIYLEIQFVVHRGHNLLPSEKKQSVNAVYGNYGCLLYESIQNTEYAEWMKCGVSNVKPGGTCAVY
jgi:hypothetical protein